VLKLSRVIPVLFRSTYGVDVTTDGATRSHRERSTWWQWRGRVFRHRRWALPAS
jgi:hypothetical protein